MRSKSSFVMAKMRPCVSAVRCMWSSAKPGPALAISWDCHVVGASASLWMRKPNSSRLWSDQKTPILSPPKATMLQMSSEASPVRRITGVLFQMRRSGLVV